MNSEEIARRYERRHGYELIDYAPVALPIYRLTVDAVTMAHRSIPPIKEFVMRSVAAGVDFAAEVAGFLGLDRAIVDATFGQLREDRYIAALDDTETARLLDRGRDVLSKARESSPQDEMLVFLYDRLLKKPIQLAADQVLVPANLDPQRMIEIRPYPADGPELVDIPLPDVLQILEQQAGGRATFGRDLLRLKRIVRRIRLYRPAVGFVYKKARSADIQIAFIVDEAEHEGLEHAFAVGGGPKKMGFVRSIDKSSTMAEIRKYLGPDVLKLLPEPEALNKRRIAVSVARLKLQAAVGRVERFGGLDTPDAFEEKEAVEGASAMLSKAETELRAFSARAIMPFEIPELLDQAINSSESLLIISSRGLGNSVVDESFLNRIEETLKRNVRVVVSLEEAPPSEKLTLEFERLRRKYPRLELISGVNNAFYHVVCDRAFALICNRPLLGNHGKSRTFSHVVGYLLQTPELVTSFTERIERRDAGLARGRRPKGNG